MRSAPAASSQPDVGSLISQMRVERFYADYVAALDAGDIERWPDFFAVDGRYRVVSAENHDSGLELALVACESRAMVGDRVHSLRHACTFEPRRLRRMITSIRLLERTSATFKVDANFTVLESRLDQLTRVFCTGRYLDELTEDDGQLRFKEHVCVHDADLIPTSFILPL